MYSTQGWYSNYTIIIIIMNVGVRKMTMMAANHFQITYCWETFSERSKCLNEPDSDYD